MSDNIVKLSYKDKEIYLVKTAHVSKTSIQDVQWCFDEYSPDTICIELDKERFDKMEDPDSWKQQDIVDIIKNKKVAFLLVNIILSSFQRRIAKQMDTNTGGEMMKGIELARNNELNLVLADRSIKNTFLRIWANLGFIEKAKLIFTIISSVFDNEEITEDDLRALKESDALEAALSEVGKEFPVVKRILVDERDIYLAEKIKNSSGKRIMAIIGAAHANGIERHIASGADVNLAELEIIKEKSHLLTVIKWAIPLFIISIILYTLFTNINSGISQIKSWILWNGTLSAIGALIAGGHILSVLCAFVMAPITSLNPLLAAGWFAGMCEAVLRKPKVSDFENIAEDTSTIKGFWRNKVTRILLIVVFANLFSSIATFISGLDIFSIFIKLF